MMRIGAKVITFEAIGFLHNIHPDNIYPGLAHRLPNMLFTELTHPVTSGQKAKKPLSATSWQVSRGEFWLVNQ